MQQALILAGGKGTRLASRLDGLPKPLVKIDGVPLLERQLTLVAQQGISQVLLLANHRIEALEEFCAGFRLQGLQIDIVEDGKGARGTAGAVYDALPLLAETFLVLYGDTLMDVDLRRLWSAHSTANREFGALGTLFLHPNDHPHDSDLVEMDGRGRIRAFHPKPHAPGTALRNMVNAALYVLDRRLIEQVPAQEGLVDFGKDLFPHTLELGLPLAGYATYEYIKDIGTPDRLDRAEADLRSGKVARSRLDHPQRAVFLDRDGTLNRPAGHVSSPDALQLIDNVGAAVASLNRAEYRCVMVTNQPVVARGECSEEGLERIHAKLETLLGQEGAFLDASYVCPHHPDAGFTGEIRELKIVCSCRKPAPGMVLQAAADLNIDLDRSWFVGDSAADIGAAEVAGVRSILVRTGGRTASMLVMEPDFEVGDLAAAANFIVRGHAALVDRLKPLALTLAPGTLVRVSGQSWQGKSLLAATLRDILHDLSRPAVHIRLARWQMPANAEVESPQALDWERLHTDLAPWLAGGMVDLALPCYPPLGPVQDAGPRLTIREEAVLIANGRLATQLQAGDNRRTLDIFVDGPEDLRADRFAAEYARRGFTPAQTDVFYRHLLTHERPLVEAQRSSADLVLSVPSVLELDQS